MGVENHSTLAKPTLTLKVHRAEIQLQGINRYSNLLAEKVAIELSISGIDNLKARSLYA